MLFYLCRFHIKCNGINSNIYIIVIIIIICIYFYSII